MYEVFRVPVDAEDDPPVCGVIIGTFHDYPNACGYADRTMEQERDPEYCYFVIDRTGKQGFYSVGYVAV